MGEGNGKIDIFKELTPHSRTYKLRGQGGKKVNTKSRHTHTSHCPTKTILKTETVFLKLSLMHLSTEYKYLISLAFKGFRETVTRLNHI